MAARVNKKFVIILTSSLLVLFALVAGAGWYAMSKRAERNVARGDEAYEAGNFYDAKQYYGRAVARDPTNQQWLELFHDALLKSSPPTTAEYDKFYDEHVRTLQKLAMLNEEDVDYQIDYVEKRDRAIRRVNRSISGYKQIERLVEDAGRYIPENEPRLAALYRYRGLATVDRMQREVVDEEARRRARNDLEEAVEFNPDDHEAALGLARWEFAEVTRHRRDNRVDAARTAFQRGNEIVDDFLAENPENPEAHLLKLRMQFQEGNRRAVSPIERTRFFEQIRPRYEETVEVFEQTDPAELRVRSLEVLSQLGRNIGVSDNTSLLAVLNDAIEARPDAPRLKLLKGRMLSQNGRHEDALATYQKVVDMPKPPVSLAGRVLSIYKNNALAYQIDAALSKHTSSTDAEKKDAAIEDAKAYRDKLAERVSASEQDMLTQRDAKIAIVEQNYAEAVSKFSEIIKAGIGDTAQNYLLLAHALEQQGNMGEARNVMLDLLEASPGNPQILMRVAEYDIKFGDYESARDHLQLALEGDPGNEQITERLQEVQTALDPDSENANPVVAMVIKSRELRDENEYEKAERMLRAGLDRYPNEYRLIREMTEVLIRQDKRDAALQIVDRALEADPNSRALQQVRLVVQEEDPVELGIKLIELSRSPEIDKLIDKYQVYRRYNRNEEAERALEQARELDEYNERLIDLEFLLAMRNGDKQTAQRIVERATESNADQVDGRLFSARYELVFGESSKAIELLDEVTEQEPRMPAAWLLLGEARMAGGRVEEAVEAFETAHEGRPTDIQIIKAYARALVRVNREEEALELITPEPGMAQSTMSDPELVEMWLSLAESYGDREEVLDMRRNLFESDPGIFNFRNAIAYFRMLIEKESWDEADRVLASLEDLEGMSELQSVMMRANMIESREGLDASVEMLESYLDSFDGPGKNALAAYINAGDFLLNRGLNEQAIEKYEQARQYQTERLEADRKLGDFYFNIGSTLQSRAENAASMGNRDDSAVNKQRSLELLEKAAAYYSDIVEAGTVRESVENQVTKRYSETLLKLGRLSDAKAAVARLDDLEDDLELTVLRASIATAEGDLRRAREIYDSAVEKFPSRTLPYIQRALFNQDNPELIPDAIRDLQQAVTLEPSRTQAWVKLYELRKAQGEVDAAFADLRRSIDANPENDSLQRMLISELLAAGRREQGLIAALDAVRKRPENQQWLSAVAQVLARYGRHREASDLYRRLIDLDEGEEPNPAYIAGLLDMTLQRTDTEISDARIYELLRIFRGVMNEESVYHLMLESRALTAVGETAQAFAKLKEAIEVTGDDGRLGAIWFQQLQMVSSRRDASYAFLERQDEQGELNPYLVAQLQNYKRNEGEPVEPLVERLDEVLANDPDLLTRLEALKHKSRFLYSLGKYQESADAIVQALEISPNDAEMNNNLAYIYVEHLQDYAKGVQYAEKAIAQNARSSTTLDTLGWAYFQDGRINEARRRLQQAIDYAQTESNRLPAHIHLGHLELREGNVRNARNHYETALGIAEGSRQLAEQYEQELEELRTSLQ